MRAWRSPVFAGVFFFPLVAQADVPVQPGLWEQTESSIVDGSGEQVPAARAPICLTAADATLDRLLMPTSGELIVRKCTGGLTATGATSATMALNCPAGDVPAVDASATIKVSPTSYEGIGASQLTAADGKSRKTSVKLAGKRTGDC